MKKYIIDRFEGEFAVLEKEGGGTTDVLAKQIPDAKEGDVVIFENGEYTVDKEETLIRKQQMQEKINKLFKR